MRITSVTLGYVITWMFRAMMELPCSLPSAGAMLMNNNLFDFTFEPIPLYHSQP